MNTIHYGKNNGDEPAEILVFYAGAQGMEIVVKTQFHSNKSIFDKTRLITMSSSKTTFQFISEPGDVNFGGKVHGGSVMKWIDQAAYTCARTWAESYCVTVYVGGIRFYKPISIGEVIKIDCQVILTGSSSIHIMVEVYSRAFSQKKFEKKTHCIIIFVAVDENGNPKNVKPWVPKSDQEKKLQEYAEKLKKLRGEIHEEMKPFFNE